MSIAKFAKASLPVAFILSAFCFACTPTPDDRHKADEPKTEETNKNDKNGDDNSTDKSGSKAGTTSPGNSTGDNKTEPKPVVNKPDTTPKPETTPIPDLDPQTVQNADACSLSENVCDVDFSPYIELCTKFGGGDACSSKIWNRQFYNDLVSYKKNNANPEMAESMTQISQN